MAITLFFFCQGGAFFLPWAIRNELIIMDINAFSAILPNIEQIPQPDAFFQTVKEQYPQHLQEGYFLPARSPSFYIQRIKTSTNTYTGFIAAVSLGAYLNGEIKGHEETLTRKAQIQTELLEERQALIKPVLVTYPNVSAIDTLVQTQWQAKAPIQEVYFEADKTQYQLWEINDAEILAAFKTLFEQHIQSVYIADGHHRILSASSSRLGLEQVVCAFYPYSEVMIRDFNRLVTSALPLDEYLLKALEKIAIIQPLVAGRKPKQKHELTFYYQQQWYSLKWKELHQLIKKLSLPLLDTQLLDEYILQNLLGIKDVRTTSNVAYIDGLQSIATIEKQVESQLHDSIAFCLYPVDRAEMATWADAGKTLPPKSTWFEPRMKNGIIVQEIQLRKG